VLVARPSEAHEEQKSLGTGLPGRARQYMVEHDEDAADDEDDEDNEDDEDETSEEQHERQDIEEGV